MKHYLYSAEQVRELDRRAIEEFQLPSYELMCKAGEVLLDIVQLRWSGVQRVLIVCGAGNNAGDGYVLARLLRGASVAVDVYSAFDIDKLQGDALRALNDYRAVAGAGVIAGDLPNLHGYGLVVDALFGSGLCRDVEGRCADIINKINQCDLPVLAVDVPSGLNATTGSICGVAIRADLTATFIAEKQGLLTNDGPDCSGQVWLDTLGLPDRVFNSITSVVQLLGGESLGGLVNRSQNAHKGSYGSLLLLGANTGMEGAIALAGKASLRVGAGLVRAAGRTGISAMQAPPDLMRADVSDSASLKALLSEVQLVAAGPGLGQDVWAKECYGLLEATQLVMLLDADALNLLAEGCRPITDSLLLTPHPAEAARLLGTTVSDVQADRFSAVLRIAKQYQAVVVLKGCGSLVSDGESVFVCNRGNPSMSVAGMGDVLTGVISGLLAQGLKPLDAAKAGVYLHAVAGDLAEHDLGIGLMASDVIDYLPMALKRR